CNERCTEREDCKPQCEAAIYQHLLPNWLSSRAYLDCLKHVRIHGFHILERFQRRAWMEQIKAKLRLQARRQFHRSQ
ncbi:MAG: hypothetical protein ACK52S_19000, partial [Pirellula sp.]